MFQFQQRFFYFRVKIKICLHENKEKYANIKYLLQNVDLDQDCTTRLTRSSYGSRSERLSHDQQEKNIRIYANLQ